MKTNYLFLLLSFCTIMCTTVYAQTEITEQTLSNAGFDDGFTSFRNVSSNNIPGDQIHDILGWEKDTQTTYTVSGIVPYGSGLKINGSNAVPTNGYNGSEGGALAFSTGWDQSLIYYQSVTLPPGAYKLVSVYYNAASVTPGSSLLGWIPDSGGSAVTSNVASFPAGTWVTDTINFTLADITQGRIQIGFKAGGNGSTNSARVLVDYVKIFHQGEADKTKLNAQITEAENLYDASGVNANVFLTVINSAKAIAAKEDASIAEVLAATNDLETAIFNFKLENATNTSPLNLTGYIINPSFESGFDGWTNNGFSTQTNSFFPKAGNTYIEKWTNRGSKIPDVSIEQSLSDLPNGKYTILVAAGNIQQQASGSAINAGKAQTGAYLFASTSSMTLTTAVDTIKDRSLDFFVLDGNVTIGLKAENATGNWVTGDNFRLHYKGLDMNDLATWVGEYITEANGLLSEKMQNSAKNTLQTAIATAQTATAANPLVATDLNAATAGLVQAIEAANTSIKAYEDLSAEIDAAEAVYDASAEGATQFKASIDEAKTVLEDLDTDLNAIYEATQKVNTAIFAFRLANASGTAPKVTTNPNYARGATAIFGRSSVSGVPSASILEQGFCWATHPEPTVLDNRTTNFFSNNGNIYHMANLEPATVYYVRAYAMTNSYAVGYGDIIKVITTPKGNVTYSMNSYPDGSDDQVRMTSAATDAVNYFNNLTSIQGLHFTINHSPGTPTADCSYGGWMRFGTSASYQRTGTVLHEAGHAVGVGTISRWHGPDSPLRASGSRGNWLGERANKVVQFFENNPSAVLTGDQTHMWPYGINGAHEDNGSMALYTAITLIYQGLGEDGLPPTSNSGTALPAYTFESDSNKKYYIKNESTARGRDNAFLIENSNGQLVYREMSADEALENDSTAWYFEFVPATAYYRIKNAATGKYVTYRSAAVTNGFSLISRTNPTASENLQIMKARVDTKIGSDENTTFTTRGYWIFRPDKSTWTPPTFTANVNGLTGAGTFNIANSAETQRWLLLSEEEVQLFKQALPSALHGTSPDYTSIYAKSQQMFITNIKQEINIAVYDVSGRLHITERNILGDYSHALPKGMYIVKTQSTNGTYSRKLIVD